MRLTFLANRTGPLFTLLPAAILALLFVAAGCAFASTASPVTVSAPLFPDAVSELAAANRTLESQGEWVAYNAQGVATALVLALATVDDAGVVDLAQGFLAIDYRDPQQRIANIPWSWEFQGEHDGDTLLEDRELAQITIPLRTALDTPLTAGTPFALELIPAKGSIIRIHWKPPILDHTGQ